MKKTLSILSSRRINDLYNELYNILCQSIIKSAEKLDKTSTKLYLKNCNIIYNI